MKTISKCFLGFVLSIAASTAFATPPAAICLNMPLTITPLNGSDITVKKMLLPFCFETKDFVQQEGTGNYVPTKPFIRVYGNGGFSENVAWHLKSYVDGKHPNGSFLFQGLSGVWESIFASFLSSALHEEGFVTLAVGSLPGAIAEVWCGEASNNGRFLFGGKGLFSDPISAVGYNRNGVRYDLLIAPAGNRGEYSVSRVEQ